MKKSNKIIIVILVLVVLSGCGVGAYFLFRNKSSGDDGSSGGTQGATTSRYDGMYYYYISGMQYKSVFIKIKGNQYESSDGDKGTYKVDGINITFYKSVMGDNEVVLSGTIEDGIIAIEQNMGGISMTVYYCLDGKMPS